MSLIKLEFFAPHLHSNCSVSPTTSDLCFMLRSHILKDLLSDQVLHNKKNRWVSTCTNKLQLKKHSTQILNLEKSSTLCTTNGDVSAV